MQLSMDGLERTLNILNPSSRRAQLTQDLLELLELRRKRSLHRLIAAMSERLLTTPRSKRCPHLHQSPVLRKAPAPGK